MILKFIKLDIENSTIEATWFNEENKQPVRCHNYSSEQAAEFAAEVEGAAAYMTAMGWTA